MPRHSSQASRDLGAASPATPTAARTQPENRIDSGVATPQSVSTSAAAPQPATRATSGAARPFETSRPRPMKTSAAKATPAQPARSKEDGMSSALTASRPREPAGRFGNAAIEKRDRAQPSRIDRKAAGRKRRCNRIWQAPAHKGPRQAQRRGRNATTAYRAKDRSPSGDNPP